MRNRIPSPYIRRPTQRKRQRSDHEQSEWTEGSPRLAQLYQCGKLSGLCYDPEHTRREGDCCFHEQRSAGLEPGTVRHEQHHPLAGMDLTFDVEIMEIREASAEELAHGHAHGPHGHHH